MSSQHMLGCMTSPALRQAVFGFGAVLALLISATDASGQQPASSASRFSFSAAFGVNVSSMTLPTTPSDDIDVDVPPTPGTLGPRIGVLGGMLVDFPVSNRLSLVSGGMVGARGGNLNVDVPSLNTKLSVDFRIIYFEIPVLISGRLTGDEERGISILGGAMLGVKLHARSNVSFLGDSVGETFTDEVAALDVGVTIGGRYHRGNGFIASYYTHGFTDTSKGDSPEPVKHRVWTTIFGVRF
jgi:hypothetical protein